MLTKERMDQVEAANDHWLNQKALALLRAHDSMVVTSNLHILTLLWEVAQHPSQYHLGQYPLDDLVVALDDLPPARAIQLLIGQEGEDQQVREHNMAQVQNFQDMLDVLWGPLGDLFLIDD